MSIPIVVKNFITSFFADADPYIIILKYPPKPSNMFLKIFRLISIPILYKVLDMKEIILKIKYFFCFFTSLIAFLYINSNTAGTHTKPLISYSFIFLAIFFILSAKHILNPV